MLYLILGILFIFQQSAEIDDFKNQSKDSFKHLSVSGGILSDITGNCEIQDDEQDTNIDSEDLSALNSYYHCFFKTYVITRNISCTILPNYTISPLLLDIPPPCYC